MNDNPEVTPEMIEAGVSETLGWDNEWDSREELVRRVYEAMIKARRDDPPPHIRT